MDKVSQKIVVKPNAHKELKKLIIDLDLDKNGKLTPEMYGQAIEHILENWVQK